MIMKQQEQLENVFSFLNKPFEFPKQAEIYLTTTMYPEATPFRVKGILSRLLLLNLITIPQRIICIFVLLSVEPEESEFVSTMLYILENPESRSFEKIMIYECWLKKNKKKYETFRIKDIAEQYQTMTALKPTIAKQLDIFKQRLKQLESNMIPQKMKSHVLPFLPDFETQQQYLTQPLSKDQFNKLDFYFESNNANFQRPLPQFMPVSESQLVWLSPGIITNVKYDLTNQFIDLYSKGQTQTLGKSQRIFFQQMIQSQIPLILTNSFFFINGFTHFFSLNPHTSLLILQLLSSQKVIEYFYDKLINVQLSKLTMESMKKLVFQQQVPKMTINYYIINTIQKCQQVEEAQQEGLARIIVALLKQFIRAKKVDIKDIEQQIRSFAIKFSHIEEVAKFYKIVVQTNN